MMGIENASWVGQFYWFSYICYISSIGAFISMVGVFESGDEK